MITLLLLLLSTVAALNLASSVPHRPSIEIGGYLGMVLFGALIPTLAMRLFQTGPIVEIDAQGIRDRRVSEDIIAWDNIARMDVKKDRQQYSLRLQLHAPAKLRRTTYNRIVSGGVSYVSINMAGLGGSFDDLMGAIGRYRKVADPT